jgi:hypothetical protein
MATLFFGSCGHVTAPNAKANTPAPANVVLELQRGPAPQLPTPMTIADSLRGGGFETCYRTFRPSGNARNDLAQMTASCGPPNSMKAVTPVFEGTQGQTDPLARFTFRGELGRCYRIFGASAAGIGDMEKAMLEPHFSVVGRSRSASSTA